MTHKAGIRIFESMALLPPLKSVIVDPAIDKPEPYLGGQSLAEYLRTYWTEVPTYYISPYWWDAHLLMASEVLFPVLQHKVTPEQGLQNMATRLGQLMK